MVISSKACFMTEGYSPRYRFLRILYVTIVNHHWLVVWNMNFMTFLILGMSSSQLTFTPSFFRGVGQQPTSIYIHIYIYIKIVIFYMIVISPPIIYGDICHHCKLITNSNDPPVARFDIPGRVWSDHRASHDGGLRYLADALAVLHDMLMSVGFFSGIYRDFIGMTMDNQEFSWYPPVIKHGAKEHPLCKWRIFWVGDSSN